MSSSGGAHDTGRGGRDAPASRRISAPGAATDPVGHGAGIELPPAAAPHLARLRKLLADGSLGDPAHLGQAFAAARGLIATVATRPADGRPDTGELRDLAAALPEFDAFLATAAGQAAALSHRSMTDLWSRLSLRAPPPTWTAAEVEAARMVFACACAPGQDAEPARIRGGLRAVAAARIARLLVDALGEQEPAWQAALGESYDSVRHRCAPRTAWRSRGLSDLLREDERARRAVQARVERWLAAGAAPAALASELEAALVHARTPPKFA